METLHLLYILPGTIYRIELSVESMDYCCNVGFPVQMLYDAIDAMFLRCGFPKQFVQMVSVVIEGVFPAPSLLFQGWWMSMVIQNVSC